MTKTTPALYENTARLKMKCMKIICSSKVLENAIRKALESKYGSIKTVKITHQKISFGRIKVSTEDNLIESYSDEFEFYPVKWYKVMLFLQQLREQPITLTIYDDLIDVYCVARF